MTLNEAQRSMLKHALGWPKCYRNYFAAELTGDDAEIWRGLVAVGSAEFGKIINQWPNELQIFHVTPAGRAALKVPPDPAGGPPKEPT